MAATDPSGMSLWDPFNIFPKGGTWYDPLNTRGRLKKDWHAASVNWNHGRHDIEWSLVIAIMVSADIASGGTLTATEMQLMDAGIGFVGGGLINARNSDWSWKGAFQGAAIGYSVGTGYISVEAGITAGHEAVANGGSFWNAMLTGTEKSATEQLGAMFSPAGASVNSTSAWLDVLNKAVGSGVLSAANGDGSVWNNFRNGFIEGGILGSIGMDYDGSGPWGYMGNQAVGEWIYRMMTPQGTHLRDFKTPVGNGLGWLIFGE